MTTPTRALNRYRADLREMTFLLFEQFRIRDLLGKTPFEAWGETEIRTTLSECYRWMCDVVGPLNTIGDREGCRMEGGRVKTPAGFANAWKGLYAAGWKIVGVKPEYGGAGAPGMLQVLVEEFVSGANIAFSMYSALAYGAAEVIERFGTPAQKELFCQRMFNGIWGGTMCLTEPHAGSDVGSSRTSATRNADGTFSIRGTKIFISGGDHDLAENIVHLVLARMDGAPPGTKGLTLFVVPRVRVSDDGTLGEDNDVAVANIEHKMGLNGSATCVLQFGEHGNCLGFPLGGEAELNRGMSQMFRMMNIARIAVGVQGLGLASSAYLNALDYARNRVQGASIEQWKDPTAPRVAIVQHADVRRMLLDMKARVEGIRALVIKVLHHRDVVRVLTKTFEDNVASQDPDVQYHQGQVELLTPLVKAYGSDQGFRICETAIQTYGGAGYTRDYPVEQYCRDAKIFSIYEGTNHIQAMDLVGRKLPQAGGANFQRFLADIGHFVSAHKSDPDMASSVAKLSAAEQALTAAAMQLLGWSQSPGNLELVPLFANRFLEMMSETAVGWVLLEGAVVASRALSTLSNADKDVAFYRGKIAAATYFAQNVLPGVPEKAQVLANADRSALGIPDAGFAAT